MTLLRSIKTQFFREPRNGTFDWIPFGFGILLIVQSIAGILVEDVQGTAFSVDPEFFLLGSAFVLMGGTKLLPDNRNRLAAFLRFATIGVFFAWLTARLLIF